MRSNYAMAQTLDAQHRTRALLYTGLTALMITLLILFLKWRIEMPPQQETATSIEVELNLPPDPPEETESDGGGGGGNTAKAIGLSGATPQEDQPSGEITPAKEVNEPEEKESRVVNPVVTKKAATQITKTSPVKSTPQKVEIPAPKQPKNVMGQGNKGGGSGADTPDDFNKSGNEGTGLGVGKGPGSGGGSGKGAGGGNGTGIGSGNGPRVTQGNRKITNNPRFDGEMDNATIFARINVSPDGKGTFVEFAKGSTQMTNQYKQAVIQYLSKIKFDPSDKNDIVVVQFNFKVN